MKKNDVYCGIVIDYGVNGEGIIKEKDKIIFVPFAMVGEKIKYQVLKVAQNIVFGKVLQILTKSNERREPICPVFKKCGGCNMQHIKYLEQLSIKQKNIKDTFYKITGMNVKVDSVVACTKEYRYRNRKR